VSRPLPAGVRRLTPAMFLAGLFAFLVTGASPPTVLDDFENPARWEAVPSDGVSLSLASDRGFRGRSMRLDFDFHGKSGWAAVRRKVSLGMPGNYEFSFRIRGNAPVNNLEFKLADESGQNVWWSNRRNFEFPKEWQRVAIKKRHISFAWGPLEKGELSRAASLEITITAGTGGKGSVWLDELTFEELPPAKPYAREPDVTATSSASGSEPRRALDANSRTAWESGTGGGEQFLSIDFLEKREFGGLVVEWGDLFPRDYVVEASEDGSSWTVLRKIEGGNGGRDYLFLPESEAQRLRLRFAGRAAVREVTVEPLEFSASENAFFERIAKDAPKGSYPRSFSITKRRSSAKTARSSRARDRSRSSRSSGSTARSWDGTGFVPCTAWRKATFRSRASAARAAASRSRQPRSRPETRRAPSYSPGTAFTTRRARRNPFGSTSPSGRCRSTRPRSS
jgi:F5/8 type C domain